jgi:hypothetical protein
MKKFSKLILETKSEIRTMSPLTNPTDWKEIFNPLIEHIEANLQSKVKGPGNAVFTIKTKSLLDQFIDQVEEDYKDYYQNEIHDGSQESFLRVFNINADYRDIIDCIQSKGFIYATVINDLPDNDPDMALNPMSVDDDGLITVEFDGSEYEVDLKNVDKIEF